MPTKIVKELGEVEQAPKILDVPIATGATGLRKESDSLGAMVGNPRRDLGPWNGLTCHTANRKK